MSAPGTKRTFRPVSLMSAFGGRPDVVKNRRHAQISPRCFYARREHGVFTQPGPKADMGIGLHVAVAKAIIRTSASATLLFCFAHQDDQALHEDYFIMATQDRYCLAASDTEAGEFMSWRLINDCTSPRVCVFFSAVASSGTFVTMDFPYVSRSRHPN